MTSPIDVRREAHQATADTRSPVAAPGSVTFQPVPQGRANRLAAGERIGYPAVVQWSGRRRVRTAVAFALFSMILAVLGAILLLCDGHLIYTLDDPYISLSLGWHIAHGEYGINAGEPAAPASSILYPFLLAGFAWTRWQAWVPLVINGFAAIGSGLLFGAAACRLGIVRREAHVVRGTVLVVALCLAINLIGLVFTGLEHSLHVLTAMFVVFGLARALEEDEVGVALIAALVILPLLRFEGLALSGLAATALVVVGQRRAAAIAFTGVAIGVGGYMAALHAMGLPPLPASVLVKSDIANNVLDQSGGVAALAHAVAENVRGSLNPEALPAFVLAVLIAAHPAVRWSRADRVDERYELSFKREIAFVAVAVGALAAHVLFGRWGEFARYEIYAVALGAAAAICLWRNEIAQVVAYRRAWPTAIATAGVLYVGWIYVGATLYTPLAARGIYEQQYQMHRFAVEFYGRPVGVNDLGWVSYRNPHYVLDLAGLASDAARRERTALHRRADWMERMAEAKQVGLVMLYDQWFRGQIPPGWRKMAELRVPHVITAKFATVSFYATSPAATAAAQRALLMFRDKLVPGTSLTLLDPQRPLALPSPEPGF